MAYHRYSNFARFCTTCVSCGGATSKTYAKAHDGRCKACVAGTQPDGSVDIRNHPMLCPDCREHLLTPYQKKHGYHCDHCTREADPEGWAREMSTPMEPDYS